MRGAHETLGLLLGLIVLGTGCATTGPRPLAWDALPFPRNSDWPGPKGLPAHIEDGDLILQGREARTRSAYSVPLTIECEFLLEARSGTDGGLAIRLIPPDQPADLNITQTLYLVLSYRPSGEAIAEIQSCNASSTAKTLWGGKPFDLRVGKPNQLQIDLRREGMRFTVNGQTFEAGDVVVPYDRFYIQIWGWQPVNRWHLRNFVVR
jgi:hypothetical protein